MSLLTQSTSLVTCYSNVVLARAIGWIYSTTLTYEANRWNFISDPCGYNCAATVKQFNPLTTSQLLDATLELGELRLLFSQLLNLQLELTIICRQGVFLAANWVFPLQLDC